MAGMYGRTRIHAYFEVLVDGKIIIRWEMILIRHFTDKS